jgi:AcrR family transcriptional regulator
MRSVTSSAELPAPASGSLIQRKQRAARQRIVDAADELFAARGFDDVSVSDIAARAEVGRTTFFRYFGDKTEVVFAKEKVVFDVIARACDDTSVGAAHDSREAIEQLLPIVLEVCREVADDPEAFERRAQLLERHVELRSRDALKTRQIAERLSALLRDRGTADDIAVFAAQIALACYETARLRAKTAAELMAATRAAFAETLSLGRGSD